MRSKEREKERPLSLSLSTRSFHPPPPRQLLPPIGRRHTTTLSPDLAEVQTPLLRNLSGEAVAKESASLRRLAFLTAICTACLISYGWRDILRCLGFQTDGGRAFFLSDDASSENFTALLTFSRSSLGIVEPRAVSLHPLRRHPPQPGRAHLKGQVRQPGLVDAGASRRKKQHTPISQQKSHIVLFLFFRACNLWATAALAPCTRPTSLTAFSGRRVTRYCTQPMNKKEDF